MSGNLKNFMEVSRNMAMNAVELEHELNTIHKTMDDLIAGEVPFYVAQVVMVNKFHITWGEAGDRLKLYESITNKQLQR